MAKQKICGWIKTKTFCGNNISRKVIQTKKIGKISFYDYLIPLKYTWYLTWMNFRVDKTRQKIIQENHNFLTAAWSVLMAPHYQLAKVNPRKFLRSLSWNTQEILSMQGTCLTEVWSGFRIQIKRTLKMGNFELSRMVSSRSMAFPRLNEKLIY